MAGLDQVSRLQVSPCAMIKGPLRNLARDTQWLPGAARHRGMARRVLVRQFGNVFNLADRLYYVDSAETFADRQLCRPDRRVQIWGQVNIRCHPGRLTAPRGIARLD